MYEMYHLHHLVLVTFWVLITCYVKGMNRQCMFNSNCHSTIYIFNTMIRLAAKIFLYVRHSFSMYGDAASLVLIHLGLHPANEKLRYKITVSHWLGANLEYIEIPKAKYSDITKWTPWHWLHRIIGSLSPFLGTSYQPMMTSSNGNIYHVTGHLCGEFIGYGWILRTKASDAKLYCFLWFDLRLNKRLSE